MKVYKFKKLAHHVGLEYFFIKMLNIFISYNKAIAGFKNFRIRCIKDVLKYNNKLNISSPLEDFKGKKMFHPSDKKESCNMFIKSTCIAQLAPE